MPSCVVQAELGKQASGMAVAFYDKWEGHKPLLSAMWSHEQLLCVHCGQCRAYCARVEENRIIVYDR